MQISWSEVVKTKVAKNLCAYTECKKCLIKCYSQKHIPDSSTRKVYSQSDSPIVRVPHYKLEYSTPHRGPPYWTEHCAVGELSGGWATISCLQGTGMYWERLRSLTITGVSALFLCFSDENHFSQMWIAAMYKTMEYLTKTCSSAILFAFLFVHSAYYCPWKHFNVCYGAASLPGQRHQCARLMRSGIVLLRE